MGGVFESYIDQFTGHVDQQVHMSYLLLDSIPVLWLTHGVPQIVLQIGI